MRQAGEYRIGAPREQVWAALNDPEVLKASLDGCEAMERIGDDAFKARVRARVGPLSAVFEGEVKLADLDPPAGYRLVASVKAGAAGFGKGEAQVTLVDEGRETRLAYEVEGSVGGKLAQVGQRLIDAAARKTADDFFARFGELVAPGAVEAAHEAAGAAGVPDRRPLVALAVTAAIALIAILVNMVGR